MESKFGAKVLLSKCKFNVKFLSYPHPNIVLLVTPIVKRSAGFFVR
jgi:hypothetical protein